MRILLAFALVAAATAITMPEPEPVQFVDAPLSENTANENEGLFADFIPETIQVGDQREFNNEFVHPLAYGSFDDIADKSENSDPDFVHPFAYSAFDEPSNFENKDAEEIPDFAVNFAEGIQAAEVPVKFVEITNEEDIAPVKFVEVADDAEEVPFAQLNFDQVEDSDDAAEIQGLPEYPYPPKIFNDPMLRGNFQL